MNSEEMESTKTSLVRMQKFDVSSLTQEGRLGQSLSFEGVVEPAKRLVKLYGRLAENSLQDLPEQQLQAVKDRANNDYAVFEQILKFDTDQGNPNQMRDSLVESVRLQYHPSFTQLHPLIAYSLHRSADFQQLDADARATFQDIKDRAAKIESDLTGQRDDAKSILDEVRSTAAERGVSQQATYFATASEDHETASTGWRTATIWLSAGLGVYAVASLFIHKIPVLAPTNLYETIQLAVSKGFIFAVVSYMLYFCARNFVAHKHNGIVNKHRQNALMTYRAIVEAASDSPNREVILNHAASCIFGPQSTGYSGGSAGEAPYAKSVVELLAKPITEND
jgi:hypothetical protein